MIHWKFYKDSFINIAGTLLGGMLGYAFQVIVSRFLPVAEYGELQSLTSLFVIVSVSTSAVSYFVIKYTSVFSKNRDLVSNKKFLEAVRGKLIKLSALFLGVVFLLNPIFYYILHLNSWIGLFIIELSTLLSFVSVIYSGVLLGWSKFFESNVAGIASAVIKLLGGLLLVFLFPVAASGTAAFLLSGIVGWLLMRKYCRKFGFFGKDGENGNGSEKVYFFDEEIKKSIVPISIFSFMITLVSNGDVILVKYFTNAELTGYYSVFALLGKIIFWVNSAVIAVVLPAACANGLEGKRLSRKMFWGSYGLLFGCGIVATILYFFFPTMIISLLFGARYVKFVQELWLFGIMGLLLSFLVFEANMAYARHDFRISKVLFVVMMFMAGGMYFYHNEIKHIVLAIIFSLGVGYMTAIFLNFSRSKACLVENEQSILQPKV